MTGVQPKSCGTPMCYVGCSVVLWRWYVWAQVVPRHKLINLDKIQIQVEAHFVSDVLKGHDVTELRVALVKYINDEMPPDDE